MKKRILYNTSAQILAKIISVVLTVVTTILITRAFGKEGYGQFSIMQTLPALFYILADFGLNTIAIKKIGNDPEKSQRYYESVLTLRPLLALAFIVVLNILTLFLPYSALLKSGIMMSSALILTQCLFSGTNLIFQYRQRYDLSSIGYVAGGLITTFLAVVFIKTGLDVRFISFSYVLGGFVTFFVNASLVKKLGYHSKFNLHLLKSSATKELLRGSLPLGLMFVFSQINFKADTMILSLMRLPTFMGLSNLESVAIYSLPYKIFEVSLALPTFLMNAIYPIFINKHFTSREDFKGFFNKIVWSMLGLGLISSLFIYIFAPFLINILGGTQFVKSVEVLRILSLGLFVFFLTQPVAYAIVTMDKQKFLPPIYLIGAIFNVSANLIFIPRFSFYASSYITWLSEILILVMLSFVAFKSWKGRKDERA